MVPGMGNATRPFYLTPEAPAYAALASFYGTPVVSMRNALWRSGKPYSNGMVTIDSVKQSDGSTPLDAGHKSITDMLVYYTQRTAQDLAILPYGEYDRNSMARDMPDRGVYAGRCTFVCRSRAWLGVQRQAAEEARRRLPASPAHKNTSIEKCGVNPADIKSA